MTPPSLFAKRTNKRSKPSWNMRRSSRKSKSSSATARQNGTGAGSRERVCECIWRGVWAFGRDGIYRVDRFGCTEMYVGEFDEDPPSEPTATELWEEYVGGETPADILQNKRLDKELMRIGRREHMKQLDESKRELDFAASGPTLRMMFVGKRTKNTKKKSKKEIFFERGERRGGDPEEPH